jgi:SAM-dependent methyltransferase
MDRNAIWTEIDALHPWMVPARFGSIEVVPGLGDTGGWSPTALRNHAELRVDMLVNAVYERCDLRNLKLLDIACNCGYFTARHAETGRVASVLGVEGREKHVKQANLYWGANRFLPEDRYQFLLADLMDPATWEDIQARGPFDLTLCCGILYHVDDWSWLLSQVLENTARAVVIDTRMSSGDEIVVETRDLNFNALPTRLAKRVPTPEALASLLNTAGWQWSVVPPTFGKMPGLDGGDDYTIGNRITIVALRR